MHNMLFINGLRVFLGFHSRFSTGLGRTFHKDPNLNKLSRVKGVEKVVFLLY